MRFGVRHTLMLALGAAVASLGCAREQGTALDRDAFYRPPQGTDTRRHVLQDQPGPLMYDNVRVNLLAPNEGVQVLNPEEDAPRESVTSVSEAVRENVELPSSTGDRAPSTSPATAPAGVSSGVAMTIGAVVCEVNGTPVYADKVLASLSRVFAAEAKRLDERAFRAFAKSEIDKQVRLFVRTELAFAAAKRNLDAREQDLASAMTMQWRARQITEAGGSIERARARAAAEGYSFDERAEEEYRNNMVRVYYQKRLFPRAQVRADEMRRYYDANRDKLFTQRDEATFRLIKIDAKRTGGAEAARRKAQEVRDRAARGEDFAELARTINDDPNLMRTGGDLGGAIQRGAFAIEPVEQAVWKLQPGQVTPVIEVGDAFYVAKLEDRKTGRVRPFEEEAVQREIRNALQGEMLAVLREREEEALMRDAIVYPFPPQTDVVLDMAMQKYGGWAAG